METPTPKTELLMSRSDKPDRYDEHGAYADPIEGGWHGYQAACHDCDWRGPLRETADENREAAKSAANADARAHEDENNRTAAHSPPAELLLVVGHSALANERLDELERVYGPMSDSEARWICLLVREVRRLRAVASPSRTPREY